MKSKERDKLINSLNELSDKDIAKQIEEVIRRNSDGENYITNLSHDLRTPINIIISIIQLLRTRENVKNDKKTIEYLDLLKKNGFKLLKLSTDIVDATRIYNQCYKFNKQNIEVVSFIESLIVSIDKYAKQKSINIIFDTNKEEVIIGIDPEALDRTIINIISNAIKYSTENSNIYINVFAKRDIIQINIKDNGRGISTDKQKVIFDRFEQAEENDSLTGSGIGLDLVRGLVKSQGGTIEIKSEVNKGTEVILKFKNKREEDTRECRKINSDDKIQQLEIEFSDIYN